MEREEIEQIMVDNDISKYDSVIEHVFNLEKQIREMRCCENCNNNSFNTQRCHANNLITDCYPSKKNWQPKETK
jgi:hypothetical protein